MSILPPDVVAEILSLLPVVDIIRLKCTCKSWYAIIKDPYFIKLHRRRSIQTNGDHFLIRIRSTHQVSLLYSIVQTYHVGPSNKHDATLGVHLPLHTYKHYQICHDGLVCFGINDLFPDFVLWNPLIDKGKSFRFDIIDQLNPELRFIHRTDIGFGYDEVSDDYKAVRVVDFSSFEKSWYSKASASEVSVVSLKNNRWRRVQDWPFDEWHSDNFGVSVSFNGALHYCTRKWWDTAVSTEAMPHPVIVVFDLTKEKFTVQKIPPFILQNKSKTRCYSTGLSVLGGHLSLYVNSLDTHEVWIMKERGGAYDTWTKLYFFEDNKLEKSFRQCKPLFLSKIDAVERVLLSVEYFGKAVELLYWYDLQRKTCERHDPAKEVSEGDRWYVFSGSLHLSDSGVDLQKLIPVEKIQGEEASYHMSS